MWGLELESIVPISRNHCAVYLPLYIFFRTLTKSLKCPLDLAKETLGGGGADASWDMNLNAPNSYSKALNILLAAIM